MDADSKHTLPTICDLPVGFSLSKSNPSKMLPQLDKEMDLLMVGELFRDLFCYLLSSQQQALAACRLPVDNL